MKTFETLESEVRGYVRSFPTVFSTARGAEMFNEEGRRYIDLFAGAGVLNYGHNEPAIKQAVIDYLTADGIVHSLDMATTAKRRFMETFDEVILKPRGLAYKMQFPGPTGTNSVEAALKLARKITGRDLVVGFTNGFHGMTLGALSVTGNSTKRAGAGVSLQNSASMPFCGYLGDEANTIAYIDAFLTDGGSGLDLPAAFIVETVQGEGGVNPASFSWLKKLEGLCRKHDVLLIVDDVQMGCGRTGPFFSFEPAGINPDIVCLSKAIGAIGTPLALTLFKPELDQWSPGEHNGTFRGNNLAFVAATAALEAYWRDNRFSAEVEAKGAMVHQRLKAMAKRYPEMDLSVRGRGLIQGLVCDEEGFSNDLCAEAFKRGVIMETSGFNDQVAKVMPPLVIDQKTLQEGLDVVEEALAATVAKHKKKATDAA